MTIDNTPDPAGISDYASPWFPAPDYGMPDATADELAAEPEDVKALRMLRVLREYAGQNIHPFSAIKLDGHELVAMRLAHFSPLMEAVSWLHQWQRKAADLLRAIHADLEHELTESGHNETLLELLAEEYEDGDDDED